MEIEWSRRITISEYRDGVHSVCALDGRVYAVGFDESQGVGRMRYSARALRSKDGKITASWSDERSHSFASLLACSSNGGKVYAFGATESFWTAVTFGEDLKLLRRADIGKPYLIPFSSLILSKFIYVAGTSIEGGGRTSACIVKLRLDDLSVVKAVEVKVNGLASGAYGLARGRGGSIVAGGFVRVGNSLEWALAVLGEDLEVLSARRLGVRGAITGLAADSDGFLYVVDGHRVAKLDPEGKVVLMSDSVSGVKVYVPLGVGHPWDRNVVVASSSNFYVLTGRTLSVLDSISVGGRGRAYQALIGSIDADYHRIYVPLTEVESESKWNWAIFALRPGARGLLAKIFRKK